MKKFNLSKYVFAAVRPIFKSRKSLTINLNRFMHIVWIISLILNIYMIYKANNQQMQPLFYVQNIEIYSTINDHFCGSVYKSTCYEHNKYVVQNLNWLLNNNHLYVPSKFIEISLKNNVVYSLNSSSDIISMLEFRNDILNQSKKNYITILENIVSLLEK